MSSELAAVLEGDRGIVVRRTFDAPRDLVFRVWTDPAHVSRWWGPNGFSTTTYSHDLRPGGSWHFTMHGPDGTDYPNFVRFEDVTVPSRLSYAHGYEPDGPPLFHQVIEFEEVSGGTQVTMHLTFMTAQARTDAAAHGALEGGEQTLARFGEVLRTMD